MRIGRKEFLACFFLIQIHPACRLLSVGLRLEDIHEVTLNMKYECHRFVSARSIVK